MKKKNRMKSKSPQTRKRKGDNKKRKQTQLKQQALKGKGKKKKRRRQNEGREQDGSKWGKKSTTVLSKLSNLCSWSQRKKRSQLQRTEKKKTDYRCQVKNDTHKQKKIHVEKPRVVSNLTACYRLLPHCERDGKVRKKRRESLSKYVCFIQTHSSTVEGKVQ